MLDELQTAVVFGEKIGAHFVEARFDDLTIRTLRRINDTWKEINLQARTGVGITSYYEGTAGYSFTTSKDPTDIRETVKRAQKMAKASAQAATLKLDFDKRPATKSQTSDTITVKTHPHSKTLEYKTDLVNRTVEAAREAGKNVQNIIGQYGEVYGKKIFTNSEDTTIKWDLLIVDLPCRVTSKTITGDLVVGSERAAGTHGLELFETKGSTPEEIGKAAAEYAAEQLNAKACPAGQFRALTDNILTGVLAHESFGHLSEGDFVVTGMSPLAGKIGTKLGTEQATIVDEGTPDIRKYGGVWIPYDDQGTQASDTIVLDKGTLKYYLQSRGTAKKLKQKPTGNCRAVHFGFMPIPRMTNTYFAPGDLSVEEALEQLDNGIYAIQTVGGQVEGDGSFLFKAVRGYWIENGEIQHPIREVSLSGNILQLLKHVEGATKDLEIKGGVFGGCGKAGQWPLPVGLGGPKVIIRDVTFGGKAE